MGRVVEVTGTATCGSIPPTLSTLFNQNGRGIGRVGVFIERERSYVFKNESYVFKNDNVE